MLRSRRASAHLELLLGQLPSSFVWTTSRDLHVTAVAGAGLSIFGLADPQEVVGQDLATLLAPTRDHGAAVIDAHRRALEGVPTQLARATRRWALDVFVEPLRDEGKIVGVGGIALDASKRHAAEHALVESEARFRTLVERMPICTYVNQLGLPIRTTYISPYVEELLGYPAEAWLQEDFWRTVLHPDDAGRVIEAARRTRETGDPFKQTYRVLARDGRVVTLLDETVPVLDEHGRPLFLQGFLLEIEG